MHVLGEEFACIDGNIVAHRRSQTVTPLHLASTGIHAHEGGTTRLVVIYRGHIDGTLIDQRRSHIDIGTHILDPCQTRLRQRVGHDAHMGGIAQHAGPIGCNRRRCRGLSLIAENCLLTCLLTIAEHSIHLYRDILTVYRGRQTHLGIPVEVGLLGHRGICHHALPVEETRIAE